MNQDLIVVHAHVKTPTAQLADYILPGDSWLERPLM
ncbi:anaerobic selenocysteine-containing dehydrogenase [Paraburkholderia sp. GAS448]